MTSIKHVGVLLLLLFPYFLSAQDSTVIRDFETWNGLSLDKSFIDNRLDFQLTQEFRFSDNSTYLNNFFTELQTDFEIFDGLKFGGGYRFIRNRKNSGTVSENRFYTYLAYKHSIERFSLSYRFQFQNQKEIADIADAVSKFRLKMKIDYNVKGWKFDPYFSAEAFYANETNRIEYVEGIEEVNSVSGFEKMRYTLGTDYKFNKTFSVGAYLRMESEFKSYPLFYNTPAKYYILGINLGIKL